MAWRWREGEQLPIEMNISITTKEVVRPPSLASTLLNALPHSGDCHCHPRTSRTVITIKILYWEWERAASRRRGGERGHNMAEGDKERETERGRGGRGFLPC